MLVGYYVPLRGMRQAQNIFLLLASLFFYAWGEPRFLPVMLVSILMNYGFGRWVHRRRFQCRYLTGPVAAAVGCNLALLFVFKYLTFTLESINALGLGWQIPVIELPIGISFFTFQALSYVLDVAMDKAEVQRSVLDLGLYISFFPQLIAGPIVKYSDVAQQIRDRKENWADFSTGCSRFLTGLGKKVLLANQMAVVADRVFALDPTALSTPMAWLGSLCYTFQIYYDFSGYSDMAIGLGSMLGFHWKENFDYPYTSLSIQEFWRRWHISLSSWFKNYVYIPLGGNRKGQAKTCRNLLFVFLLTGIWHGANFTFIIWGLMYAVLLVAERLLLGRLLQKNPLKILNWAYTMFFVMTGWVFFRSDNLVVAKRYLGQLFSFGTSQYSVLSYLSMQVLLALFFGLLGAGFLQRAVKKTTKIFDSFALQMAVLAVSILWVIAGTYNPFIYFQF